MSKRMNTILARSIRFSPLILLAVLCAVVAVLDASVFSPNSVVQILVQSAPIILLSLPVMVWLISGNMDMSASFGSSFYVIVLGNMLVRTDNLLLSLLTTFGVALLVGLFNGLFVGIFEIPSFIVTLASMSILQGLILILSASQSVIIDNPVLKMLGAGKFLGIPVLLWYTAFVVVLVWAIMKYTRFGANVYAIGSNINAARVSGMNIALQQIKIFLFSALFTSLASVALAARVSVVSPSLGGTTFLLNSVTACIIGGTASTGGKGNVPGTVVGAVMIGVINFMMTALSVSSNLVSVVQGLIIIAALALDTFLGRTREKLEKGLAFN